jgi:hypothetical protein
MSIIRTLSVTAAAWSIAFALAYVAHIEPANSLLEFLAGAMSGTVFIASVTVCFGLLIEHGFK